MFCFDQVEYSKLFEFDKVEIKLEKKNLNKVAIISNKNLIKVYRQKQTEKNAPLL